MGYHKNSFNKVILTGYVGQEPELKKTDKKVSYLRFSLATTYVFNDNEEMTWHNCVAWGSGAEILAEHLAKGRKLQMEGRLRTVCSNGMIVGDTFERISVKHINFNVDEIVEASYEIIENNNITCAREV